MHKRIVNFRGFLVCGLILIAHILLSYSAFSSIATDTVNAFTYIAIILACLIFAALIFLIIFLWIKFGYNDKVLTFIITLICCIVTTCSVFKICDSWPIAKDMDDIFSARIESALYSEEYNTYTLILDRVSTENDPLNHKVILYVDPDDAETHFVNQEKFSVGKEILFKTTLQIKNLDGYTYNTDIAYSGDLKESDIAVIATDKLNIIEKLQEKLHGVLIENLGYEIGELSYSMLTGDKNNLSSEIKDSFSLSGLGHILAVSGLHISFITMLLFWILKKCKVNKYVNLVITALMLLFYCALAGFSGSVMRAAIMTIIALIASILGSKNDVLNSLFFSVVCILVFRPLLILYVGFLLSITSVFGIITFSPFLTKCLQKIKFPKFLANGISVTISATMCIMPLTICYFKFISPYSILTNLIALPLIGICFIGIFITSILTMIMPFMGIFLKIVSLGLALLNDLSRLIAKIPGSSTVLFGGMAEILLIYLLYFVAGRYVMKGRLRVPIIILCFVLICTTLTIPNIYKKKSDEIIFFRNGYNVQSILLTGDKKSYFIGDFGGFINLKEAMFNAKIKKFDAIYLTSISDVSAYHLKRYFDNFPVVPVYIPIDPDVKGLGALLESGIEFETFEQEHDFGNGLVAAYYNNEFKCYKYASGYGMFAFFPKFVEDFPSSLIDDVMAIRAYSDPKVGDKSQRFDDIIFMVNKENYNELHYCYEATEESYIDLITKEIAVV